MKKKKRSPTSRTLEWCRKLGWSATEADTLSAIMELLSLYPHKLRAWRQNVGVARSLDGERVIRFGATGAADITGILRGGRRLEIEVKSSTGRLRPAQSVFRAAIEAMGGLYVVARSVEDVQAALRAADVWRPQR